MPTVDIRIDAGITGKGKTRRLIRLIGDHGFACLFRLWFHTAVYFTKGVLKGMTNDDIEEVAGWKGDPGVFVSTLIDEAWLDKHDGTGELAIHDWKVWQPWIYFSDERSAVARDKALKRWGKAKGVKTLPAEMTAGDLAVAKKPKSPSLEDILPVKEIIDYLNARSGKNFSSSSRTTKGHIAARWKEGFGVDDFRKVIDHQVAKWKGDPKMEEYLRPQTLFNGEKFESYLNAPPPADGVTRGTDTAGRTLEELR